MIDLATQAQAALDQLRARDSDGDLELLALEAQTLATLAVASEQRTANLLAAFTSIAQGVAAGIQDPDAAIATMHHLNKQIAQRLDVTPPGAAPTATAAA